MWQKMSRNMWRINQNYLEKFKWIKITLLRTFEEDSTYFLSLFGPAALCTAAAFSQSQIGVWSQQTAQFRIINESIQFSFQVARNENAPLIQLFSPGHFGPATDEK